LLGRETTKHLVVHGRRHYCATERRDEGNFLGSVRRIDSKSNSRIYGRDRYKQAEYGCGNGKQDGARLGPLKIASGIESEGHDDCSRHQEQSKWNHEPSRWNGKQDGYQECGCELKNDVERNGFRRCYESLCTVSRHETPAFACMDLNFFRLLANKSICRDLEAQTTDQQIRVQPPTAWLTELPSM
jgi:hypothetical protein